MRRSPLFAILLTLALAVTAYAAPAKTREVWASGEIARYDAAAKSVVVKQGMHELTFVLAPDAHLMKGGKALQPGDLANDIGRQVKVRYTIQGANKVADRLDIAEPAAVKPPVKK